MHFKFRNVNEAFRDLVWRFKNQHGLVLPSTSRNGPVLYIQEPVTMTYTHPRERVLFNQARDCNPFFHVYEALWMLAGRNDVAPLKYYVSTIDQFSDDGVTFNGAYGNRWRHAWGPVDPEYDDSEGWCIDQLKLIIDHLKAKPDSRRAVLHMSNVEDDLLKMDTTKDQCCNLVVTFAIRQAHGFAKDYPGKFLDMTVFNRSNDLVWGALGANVVHFSMLQEYMAACIGVEVGMYHQITNNLHAYQNDKWQPEKWLADSILNWYITNDHLVPLVKDPTIFDRECAAFVERHSSDAAAGNYTEPFLSDVAQPMCVAFHYHKRREYAHALMVAASIKADDWRIAAANWLLKRKANYESRRTEVH